MQLQSNKYIIKRLDSSYFDWSTWRCNNLLTAFNIKTRTYDIIKNSSIIKTYAIGYCNGESLICRPKQNYYAVMFYSDNEYWRTHFNRKEFEKCFMITQN